MGVEVIILTTKLAYSTTRTPNCNYLKLQYHQKQSYILFTFFFTKPLYGIALAKFYDGY